MTPLHCPFCGAANATQHDCSGRVQQLICAECGARGPERDRYLPALEATSAWNTRAAVPLTDDRKPWERSDWDCARATATSGGLHCPRTGRCPDCPADVCNPNNLNRTPGVKETK